MDYLASVLTHAKYKWTGHGIVRWPALILLLYLDCRPTRMVITWTCTTRTAFSACPLEWCSPTRDSTGEILHASPISRLNTSKSAKDKWLLIRLVHQSGIS